MSDALDRLKQRQRPKVAPRDASLTSRPQDVQTSKHKDIQMSKHMEYEGMEVEAAMAGFSESSELRRTDVQTLELRGMETSRPLDDESPTKRSTFRLDAHLIERLHTFCRHQGLSREVLIEAMYEYMEAHPEALAQVVKNASQKHDYRQQQANRKRAEAMMSKFGRDS